MSVSVPLSKSWNLPASASPEVVKVWRDAAKKVYAEVMQQPAFVFGVFLQQVNPDAVRCELYYQVLGENKTQVAYGKRSLDLSNTGGEVIVHGNADDWVDGVYTFQAKAVLEEPPRATTTELKFNGF